MTLVFDRLDVAAFILVILTGAALFFTLLSPTAPSSASTDPCRSSKSLDDASSCVAQFAAQSTNLFLCQDAPLSDNCAGLYALQKSDPAVCSSWVNPDACLLGFARGQIHDGASSSALNTTCALLSDSLGQDTCRLEAAWVLNDVNLCNGISRGYLLLECQRPMEDTP